MAETECVIQQAGAIVVRPGTPPKVLLVRAKKNHTHWIFPKGHIEPDETAEDASARELLEEAGIRGKPLQCAGQNKYRLDNKTYNVLYYLCRYVSRESKGESGRAPCWCTIDEALTLLTFPDSRKVLKSMVPYINT